MSARRPESGPGLQHGGVIQLRRRSILFGGALLPFAAPALLRAGSASAAETWRPQRPVRLVVPYAPGGNSDVMARLAASGMGEPLAQTIVVDNKAGAGGSIGASEVARAEPDGYTLLSGSNGPLAINPFIQASLGYDPRKDFAPIGLVSQVPHTISVPAASPAKTLAQLISMSKADPMNFGSAGTGSGPHLTLELFNAATDAKLVHVPYRGGGALVPDLIAGNIDGAILEYSTALPLAREGKIRLLAIASAQRSPLMPEVPTCDELGVKDFRAASWVGFVAPAATPKPVIAAFAQALSVALHQPDLVRHLRDLGGEPASETDMTPAGFGAFLQTETEKVSRAVKIAELKPS